MSITIQYEVRLLAASFATGLFLMVIYDGLRLLRLLIPHGVIWTGIEDAFYWLSSSIITFLLLLKQNDGVLRGFAIIGVLAGMFLYNISISKIQYRLLKKIQKYFTIRRAKRTLKQKRKNSKAEVDD